MTPFIRREVTIGPLDEMAGVNDERMDVYKCYLNEARRLATPQTAKGQGELL